ncbi:HvfA family oxazolone/thioamide-modified RiPP metallophore [Microbulbifer litoralis]|uniref:HvfA family oxazolone/thioamide-modified RiPP metallophore n=1 Tax=Microbulbifer litoralis TaxID=2933965 RepID=UPI00202938DF|nr:hypothetical protein [Microbulbifer sp. GX H0434]
MSRKNLSPVATAVGAAFLASAAMNVSAGHADANPFAAEKLSSGYNLAAQDQDDSGKKKEGNCGEDKKKEGKCGDDKKKDKKKEGKCGEGKCGG